MTMYEHKKKELDDLILLNNALCRNICETGAKLQSALEEVKKLQETVRTLHREKDALLLEKAKEDEVRHLLRYDLQPENPHDVFLIKIRYGLFGKSQRYKNYVMLPGTRETPMNQKNLSQLANLSLYFFRHIGGGKNIEAILETLLLENPNIIKEISRRSNLTCFREKLTNLESLEIKNMIGLSWDKIKILKRYLTMRKLDIFASEEEMIVEESQRRTDAMLHFEDMNLLENGQKVVKSSVCTISVVEFTQESFDRLIQDGCHLQVEGFGKEIWIALDGYRDDEGWTKLTMTFLNIIQQRTNATKQCHTVGMYDGIDSMDNIRTVFGRYTCQFNELKHMKLPIQTNDKSVEMYPVRIFLTGTATFLSSFIGHLEEEHPCLFCEIPRAHLEISGLLKQFAAEEKYSPRTFDSTPLCKFSVEAICPPVIDVLREVLMDVLKVIETECQQIDQQQICKFLNFLPEDMTISKLSQLDYWIELNGLN